MTAVVAFADDYLFIDKTHIFHPLMAKVYRNADATYIDQCPQKLLSISVQPSDAPFLVDFWSVRDLFAAIEKDREHRRKIGEVVHDSLDHYTLAFRENGDRHFW